jgi:hypothetical protein
VPLMLMASTSAMGGASDAELEAGFSDDPEVVAPATGARMVDSLRDLLSVYPPNDAAELREAVEQFMSFVAANPEALLGIMGDEGEE